jgi:hypothetical protein
VLLFQGVPAAHARGHHVDALPAEKLAQAIGENVLLRDAVARRDRIAQHQNAELVGRRGRLGVAHPERIERPRAVPQNALELGWWEK